MPIFKRRRKLPLRVEDLMSTPAIVASRDSSIESVAKIMRENNVGSVVVVDGEGKVVGIVTERDMIYAIASGKIGKGLPVWSIMTENPLTVGPGAPVSEAIRIMREANVRHLPVVDRDNRPLGMVSLRDILQAVTSLMEIFYDLRV